MELQLIQNQIFEIRGQKVMLDTDLADLFEIELSDLQTAVQSNMDRFPHDFMFGLTEHEYKEIKTIPNAEKIDSTHLPDVFTEQGVAMLAGILDSPKAVEVSLAIIRGFVQLKRQFTDYRNIKERIIHLEQETNRKFDDVVQALKYLHKKEQEALQKKQREPIGFKMRSKE